MHSTSSSALTSKNKRKLAPRQLRSVSTIFGTRFLERKKSSFCCMYLSACLLINSSMLGDTDPHICWIIIQFSFHKLMFLLWMLCCLLVSAIIALALLISQAMLKQWWGVRHRGKETYKRHFVAT